MPALQSYRHDHQAAERWNGVCLLLLLFALILGGCRSSVRAPLTLAERVDLPRFMGDWYVIAATPTFIDRDAHNALESYRLAADGSIETTYSFRAGSFTGEPKRYSMRGFVYDTPSNATWGMQFIWPIKADYRIAFVSPGYDQTVIAREKRDYVWIMARTPRIPDPDYDRLIQFVTAQGYDPTTVRKIPQRWDPQ